MKFAPYSYSKINTWLQCPRKFKYQYVDKIGTFESNIALDRGKFIHCLLEFNGDLNQVKNSGDYKKVLKSGIMSKDDYKDCIQIYRNFKSSKIGLWIDSKEQMFNELPIGMDKFLNIREYSNPENIFRGYIDKVIRDHNTLILIDYKTGKYKEDMNWDQLLYYGIALFSQMPFDNILLMNVFVEHLRFNKTLLKREDIKKYQKVLLTNIKNVEDDTIYDKNETALCNWCPFQKTCLKDNSKIEIEIDLDDIPF